MAEILFSLPSLHSAHNLKFHALTLNSESSKIITQCQYVFVQFSYPIFLKVYFVSFWVSPVSYILTSKSSTFSYSLWQSQWISFVEKNFWHRYLICNGHYVRPREYKIPKVDKLVGVDSVSTGVQSKCRLCYVPSL